MTMDDDIRSPPLTATTRNFRESIHLIPTLKQEDRPKAYEPPQLHLYVIIPASLFMIALGIALEVALSISQKHQGFNVPEKNVFKFASQQFLTSFIPILFVAPLVLLWESKNWLIKRYQPYINLARGDADAEDSILLDYISINSVLCVWVAYTKKHWLVFIAALCGLTTLLLQPLAGSIFDIQQVPVSQPGVVTSIRQLGLDPDRFQLQAFLAAAGYVLAAVSNGLLDPPFIHQNWAAADFIFPTGYLNGTVNVNTTGIRTNATCSAPTSITLTDVSTPNAVNISGTSQDGCSVSVQVNTSNSNQQYGVSAVPGCGPHASLGNNSVLPVFFWFYHDDTTTGKQLPAGVFCSPTLEVFNINANASLNDGSLGNVTKYGQITASNSNNNVTGSPLNGVPFNGVIFDAATIPDEFAQARAIAIQNGVPGAILRSVTTNSSISGNAFNTSDGFVNTTSAIYTQFLALSAKNTYYLQHNTTLPSTVVSLKPKLVIEPLAAHFLAVILLIIGTVMLVLGLVHRQIRKGVFLASPPGSIASAVALTSHSGFGMFLVPYDTEVNIATKLDPLLFRLDKRTGAIVAVDKPGYEFEGRRPGPGARSGSQESEKVSEEAEPLRRSGSVGSRSSPRASSPLIRDGLLIEPFTPPSHPATQ